MKPSQIQVKIYTDGACSGNPGPGAWAAILIFGEIEKEISGFDPDTTNNRMELQAAVEGLKALKQPCKVDLYSDSAYLVSGFNKGWLDNWQAKGWKNAAGNPVSNIDLWQELLQLSQEHQVSWHKVKGHADNPYNNRCDEIARGMIQARRDADPDQEANVGELDSTLAHSSAAHSSAVHSSTDKNRSELKAKSGPTKSEQNPSLPVQVQHFDLKGEKILADKQIFQGRILDFHHYKVQTEGGREAWREVVHHGGGVGIVALTAEREVLLVSQYRLAADQVLLEIPAGCLEPGEEPLRSAQRELEEETGYKAQSWHELGNFYVSPGYTDEVIHVFLARDLIIGQQNLDPEEYLNVSLLTLDQAMQACRERKIHDAKTIIGLCLAQDWLRQNEGGLGAES